jgi:crotonobetainyl-CoA:carnitine CoA-transferase CaiB-like acyl-CoA transferase
MSSDRRESPNPHQAGLPLSNIRVLDMSRVFAMPYAGAFLAGLGAEVIKVESCQIQFMDTTRTVNGPYPGNEPGERYWERGGTFQTLNRGKRSLTLDLRSEEALEIVKSLVAVSDIVLENFTPRVMRRFGLDYTNLRAVKPDLIMVSNTGYGHSGPWSDFGAMASALESTHGTGAFMGYLEPGLGGEAAPGSVPNKIGHSYTDFLASWTAQLAVLAALIHRAKTGQGVWFDLAMYQVGVSFIGEGMLDYAFNGRSARRIGNRHRFMSPHGCYPCRGEDNWVTLAVRDDSEWEGFCQALGKPELSSDPRFALPLDRQRHQDRLDEIITEWTSAKGSYQVMDEMQRHGVPAGPVLNARQLLADPHFRQRGFFEAVEHPKLPTSGQRGLENNPLGRREYVGRGWKMSAAEIKVNAGAPILGEANDHVLGGLLGMDQKETQRLQREGITGTEPVGGGVPGSIPLADQVELGWIAGYDPEYGRPA